MTYAQLPALLELCEQARSTTHRIGVAGHTLGAAILPLGHQPGTLQHGHVFLHGGKRHVVVGGELAHGRVGVHDPRQDVATRGIGERPEQLVQGMRRRVPIYNHLVVDSSTARSEIGNPTAWESATVSAPGQTSSRSSYGTNSPCSSDRRRMRRYIAQQLHEIR